VSTEVGVDAGIIRGQIKDTLGSRSAEGNMDKTELVDKVKHLFQLTKHDVQTSVSINNREIDVRATETQGIVRKIILIECADYSGPVGVDKLQFDIRKLDAAKEVLKDRAVLMHVCEHGYTKDAYGYANERGIDAFTYENLLSRLINFDDYVSAVENDLARPVILKEYQPTRVHDDTAKVTTARPALSYLVAWLSTSSQWLTVLGDYGVGKSWMLKRLLYDLLEKYKNRPLRVTCRFLSPYRIFLRRSTTRI
jgi:Restriction endonuclease